MSFKISLIDGKPEWDSLPVAKIVTYPLEPRDYKPFAQARLCISPESIWVRMWAFEAQPSPTSALMVRMNLFPEQSDCFFSLSASRDGKTVNEVYENGTTSPMAARMILPRVKAFQSEDLQGIYWGAVFELPRALLPKLYGSNALPAGKAVRGNFYKIDADPCSEHYGCFYPVDFRSESALGAQFFGDFELVEY